MQAFMVGVGTVRTLDKLADAVLENCEFDDLPKEAVDLVNFVCSTLSGAERRGVFFADEWCEADIAACLGRHDLAQSEENICKILDWEGDLSGSLGDVVIAAGNDYLDYVVDELDEQLEAAEDLEV